NSRLARQYGYIGHETNIVHQLFAFGPGIAAEHLQLSLIGGKFENRVERSGLAGAVRTDQPKDAPLLPPQVCPVQCDGWAEGLVQAAGFYTCHGFSAPLCRTRAFSICWALASQHLPTSNY